MNQKITCPCGKNIHVEGDFAYDKGKCPRCGRMLQLRPAAPASRSSRPARHAPLGILLASITAGVCALVAVPALILALTLRAQNAQLAEQLQAVQATQSSPPARVAQSSRETSQSGVTTDPAQLAQLRDQLRQLGQRVDALARNKPTTAPATPDPIRGNSGTSLEAALIRVAQGASPAVVSIETERGTGSGVVISANGYILTNDHVVGGRQRIVVHFPSGN